MSTVTDSDLKRLEDLIIGSQKVLETRLTGIENRLTGIENRLTGIEKGQTEIKERLAVTETRLQDWKPSIDKIPDLAEKVGELKNWRQIVIIVITALISGSITWVIRGGTLKP